MGQLKAEQLHALSVQFTEIANTILNYRMKPPFPEMKEEIDADKELETLQNKILDQSTTLATQSAIQVGDEALNDIHKLSDITINITKNISGLKKVQEVIKIAAAVLKVVVCLNTIDIGGIKDSIMELADSCGIHL